MIRHTEISGEDARDMDVLTVETEMFDHRRSNHTLSIPVVSVKTLRLGCKMRFCLLQTLVSVKRENLIPPRRRLVDSLGHLLG